MSYVYPCETMNIHSFEKYIKSFKWLEGEEPSHFLSKTKQLFRLVLLFNNDFLL